MLAASAAIMGLSDAFGPSRSLQDCFFEESCYRRLIQDHGEDRLASGHPASKRFAGIVRNRFDVSIGDGSRRLLKRVLQQLSQTVTSCDRVPLLSASTQATSGAI